jgi:uncharacterized protein (DUF1501 family)
MTKSNFNELTRTQLFAHNAMQHETARVDPLDQNPGTGVLGRAKDALTRKGHVVNSFSVDTTSVAVEGDSGTGAPATSIISRNGSQLFASRPQSEMSFPIEEFARQLNQEVDEFSGHFADLWSHHFVRGVDEARTFQPFFDGATLASLWDTTGYSNSAEQEHWEKWRTISKLIKSRTLRNVDRDIFFTELGSWDHHIEMKENIRYQLHALNHGLRLFVNQLKVDGMWNQVSIIITSDFGRALNPNR